MRSNEFTAHLL